MDTYAQIMIFYYQRAQNSKDIIQGCFLMNLYVLLLLFKSDYGCSCS